MHRQNDMAALDHTGEILTVSTSQWNSISLILSISTWPDNSLCALTTRTGLCNRENLSHFNSLNGAGQWPTLQSSSKTAASEVSSFVCTTGAVTALSRSPYKSSSTSSSASSGATCSSVAAASFLAASTLSMVFASESLSCVRLPGQVLLTSSPSSARISFQATRMRHETW